MAYVVVVSGGPSPTQVITVDTLEEVIKIAENNQISPNTMCELLSEVLDEADVDYRDLADSIVRQGLPYSDMAHALLRRAKDNREKVDRAKVKVYTEKLNSVKCGHY